MSFLDNFIDIPFTRDNLDLYIVRTSIKRAIDENLFFLEGALLDIGCGQMPYKNYILHHSAITSYTGVDIESSFGYHEQVKPDYFWDGVKLPFEDDQYDCALSTEVLEHVPRPLEFMAEACRVLKPGGLLFFTTPFLWPLHDAPYDEWRLTPFSLERLLKEAGFKEIELKALGGWHASMAQMLGLWIKRAPIHSRLRKLLFPLVLVAYKRLLKWDTELLTNFKDGAMITGLYGTARKG